MVLNLGADTIFLRKLRFDNIDGSHVITEQELLARPEPIVVLGEAGAGKTTLLRALSKDPSTRFVTARKIIRSPDPRSVLGEASILLIDAVDEVSAREEGDVIDSLLHQLELAGHPKFILSCRIADWRSATSVAGINEDYERPPLEVRLEDLTEEEILEFLSNKYGGVRAGETVSSLARYGMAEMFGNPQNLMLLDTVLRSGQLPTSTTELFEKSVELMWSENNQAKSGSTLSTIGRDAVLDSVGSAFAAIILGGKDAISKLPAIQIDENDLPMSSLSRLPGGENFAVLTECKLVGCLSADRFTYVHRRIGEFLAARWLAKSANNPSKRRRLLALFKSGGLVPASLRGLHAWLGLDPALTMNVISGDPMGFVEYGDAANINSAQANHLFDALGKLSISNPKFRDWGVYRASSLVQGRLTTRAMKVIKNRNENFRWRSLLLQQFESAATTNIVVADLTLLMMDNTEDFGIRYPAAVALIHASSNENWPLTIESLRQQATHDATRLALDIVSLVGFEQFDDTQLVGLIFAHAGLSICAVPKEQQDNTVGSLYRLQRRLPDERLNNVIGLISDYADALLPADAGHDFYDVVDTAYHLIQRRLELGPVEPATLWHWVKPFEEQRRFGRDSKKSISNWLMENDYTRRGIQKIVIFGDAVETQMHMRAYRMTDRLAGLSISDEDAVCLLSHLDPENRSDERWRDVVQLVRHDKELGGKVRKAAHIFAVHRPDLIQWLKGLAKPKRHSWELEQERKTLERRAKQRLAWNEHREAFSRVRDKIRSGNFNENFSLSQAYLKLFHDSAEKLPAHERIAAWVGEDIQADAFAGFEAFFKKEPPWPTALEISESAAENKRWNTGPIIIAAAAERVRNNIGFSDIITDRLIAVHLELENTGIGAHAAIEDVSSKVEFELRSREGAWEELIRTKIEPHLKKNRDRIYGLYGILRSEPDNELTASLAVEWLSQFPRIAANPEQELIDRAIDAGRYNEIRQLAKRRLKQKSVIGERLINWKIVNFLTDFDNAASDMKGISARDPNFLWEVRSRLSGSRGERPRVGLSVSQLSWLIQEFRSSHPLTSRPTGGTTGDSNAWDASDYIHGLIGRLGQDPSDEALAAISNLGQTEDSYTFYIKVVAAEQRSIRSDRNFRSPSINDLAAVLSDSTPTSVADLKTVVMEELDVVQAKVISDEIESWRGFFNDEGQPNNEDKCRDHLIGMLRQGLRGITYNPEGHLSADKEVDISCEVGPLRMPVEVKGQWHDNLWSAADNQLARYYTSDWRAERQGIFLILWFGRTPEPRKRLKRNAKVKHSMTADTLKQAIIENSTAASAGLVDVFILNLDRQSIGGN